MERVAKKVQDILSEEGMTEIGFAGSLSKRSFEPNALTAVVAVLPVIYAKVLGAETPLPLVVGKYYDSSDDDEYSPEAYEFIRERAMIFDPHMREPRVVYDYRRENGNKRYRIADEASFFRLAEDGHFEPFTPE